MKKNNVLLLSSLVLSSLGGLASCGGTTDPVKPGPDEKPEPTDDPLINNHDPFDYDGNFEAPELLVDGVRDEVYDTKGSQKLYIDKGSDHELEATFYRGEKALFVYFDVKDNNLLSYGDSAGDDVTHGDSIEFYLDTKNDGGKRAQPDDFQFNFGVHNKTRIMQGSGSEWGNWSGLVQYENVVEGTLNDPSDVDTGWKCEVMVPYKELGITQTSPLGVALGRVEKFGQGNVPDKDFKWFGLNFEGKFVEPQTIDNYITLLGRKFYLRENTPLIKTINGVITDAAGNVLADTTVKIGDVAVKTDAEGKFVFVDYVIETNDFVITVEKENYVTREIKLTKAEAATFENEVLLGTISLAKADENIATTFVGSVKNVTNGVLEGVKVQLGEAIATTNEKGEFKLSATFKGNAELTFSKEGYVSSKETVLIQDINVNGETSLGIVGINLNYGEFNFGGKPGVVAVKGGATRGLDEFVFKFTSQEEIKESNFVEFWIDAKSTSESRDATDYTFKFNADKHVLTAMHMTGEALPADKVSATSYKEGNDFVIEAHIKYDALDVQAGEIIGISAGVLFNGQWDGFGFNDKFVAPEIPSKYVRVGLDSTIYEGANNIGGTVDPFVFLDMGEFGFKFGGVRTEITRDLKDSLFIKFTANNGWDETLKIEFYIDTNKAPTEARDTHTYRIDCWGNGDVSLFGNYKGNGDNNAMNDMTAANKTKIKTTVSGKILTMNIPYELLGITSEQTFGISQGLWNQAKQEWDGFGYDKDGYSGFVAPEQPIKYIRINGLNQVTTDPLSYTNLGSVGGKSKGELVMSTLAMRISRQEEESMILDITNETYKFEEARLGKENLEFYIDFGAKARTGEAQNNGGMNFRDEKVFKVLIDPKGELVNVWNYASGDQTDITPELKEAFTVTRISDNRIQLKVTFANLPMEEDKTIGFSAGVWSNEITDWCPYNFGKERRVENAGFYLRIDKNGNVLAD